MAYPSKIARECERADQRFEAWRKSLAALPVADLQAQLALSRRAWMATPARHTRLATERAARVSVLAAALAQAAQK